MSPGQPTIPLRLWRIRSLALTTTALVLFAALAIALIRGDQAAAETVTYLPAGAGCSNSAETDDTPAACSASAATLAPGGGAAIVENDDTGAGQGDDDLQIVFDLSDLSADDVTGASLRVDATRVGAAGVIQLGGPQISDTNYGSVGDGGGTTSNGALLNAVRAAAGGGLTVWLQVDCQPNHNDCGVAVDSVRLLVDLEGTTGGGGGGGEYTLMVSDSPNRSGAQKLAGTNLTDNAYIFISPAEGISQVRFFLDNPERNDVWQTENFTPWDFVGGTVGSANAWNPDSVADGSHTIQALVLYEGGDGTIARATFTTNDGGGGGATPTPTPTATATPSGGSYDVYVSSSSNRSNPDPLNGQTLSGDAYVFVAPGDGISQARFYLDNRNRNGQATHVENVIPFDLRGGTASNANPFDVDDLPEGTHWITVAIDAPGGTQIVEGSFEVEGGGSTSGSGGGSIPLPDGAIRITPGQSIQAAVNSNPNGTTFVIGSGVHRMQQVSPKNGNTFIGESGAVLNGSRVLNSWQSSGNFWYATNQSQEGNLIGACRSGSACRYPEQLFVDGNPLQQVTSLSGMSSGQWYFDYGANRIYIRVNPGGRFIETSVSGYAFRSGADNVTISGLVIEKYSNPAQVGAVHADGSNWTISTNEIRYNHGVGIRGGTAVRALNNYIHHQGQLGVGGTARYMLFQGNEVAYNNTEGYFEAWEAGGSKFAVTRDLTVRANHFHHNDGRGIWTDIDAMDVLIEDNLVEYNLYAGIAHEISYDAIIRNNVSRYNGTAFQVQLWGAQILVQDSKNVQIYGNTVTVAAAGGDGIGLVDQNRGSGQYGTWNLENVTVRDNHIYHESSAGNNGIAGGCNQNNSFNRNTYHVPNGYENLERWEYCGPKRTWSQFRSFGMEAQGTIVHN